MNQKPTNYLWDATKNELAKGYSEKEKEHVCLICDAAFEKGCIYEIDQKLYDSRKAVQLHIEKNHGSVLTYYIGMNSEYTGISEVQRDVIELMAKGLSDKEIAKQLGVADSTVRNHRFKLREKEKQAKIFLAIMELLAKNPAKEPLVELHKSATTIDERYLIAEKETADTIKNYFDENGALKNFPSKEKRKIIVLREIAKNFSKGKKYTEPELNRTLERIHSDYPTIRRYLIEYGFFDRTRDCKSYWLKD